MSASDIPAGGGRSGAARSPYLPVLDGVRAFAILGIVWYHFWQQSWVELKIFSVSLDWFERTGYLLVDLLLLLSGFCLYLPYAAEAAGRGAAPSARRFYRNRAARIAPSYYACLLLITLIFVLPSGGWPSLSSAVKDILPHLLFLQNWFRSATVGTMLNGVLWTVAVEVQFYFLFPALARSFQKRPAVTYLLMVLTGVATGALASAHFDALSDRFSRAMVVNHTLSFASVYANGMLGAKLYCEMSGNGVPRRPVRILCSAGTLLCCFLYYLICSARLSHSANLHWQLDFRYPLSLFFLLFILLLCFSSGPVSSLFGNRVAKFLSSISYNLYIWHQYIAVKLKDLRVPRWSGDTAPNITGDLVWMHRYLALCAFVSFTAAVFFTYALERPAARLLRREPRSFTRAPHT